MSELRVTIKSAAMELAAYIKAHNLRCGGPENEHDMQTCHDLSVAAEEVSSLQQQNTALQQQVKDLQIEIDCGGSPVLRNQCGRCSKCKDRMLTLIQRVKPDSIEVISEIKAAAIREAIEKHSYSMMNFNHAFVRVCETSHLEEYANTLSSKGGD